jgi:hypothetical protein
VLTFFTDKYLTQVIIPKRIVHPVMSVPGKF